MLSLLPTTLLLLLSAPLSLTAPSRSLLHRRDVQSGPWSVTSFSDGCSPGGCVYNFDITSSPSTPSPASPDFSTHCTAPFGTPDPDGEVPFKNCADQSVSFRILNYNDEQTGQGTVVEVIHSFENETIHADETLWGASPTIKSPFPTSFEVEVTATSLSL
ncbi:MAG: hypothetical protein Q9227_003503 [Pyrenula ochraceoflavens]